MASYPICSSLINDNMINETSQIVKHVVVDISRSQGCKNTTCQNEKIVYLSRVKAVEENVKKGQRRMNRRYLEVSVGASVRVLGTLREDWR
jgi:hypothetical protein